MYNIFKNFPQLPTFKGVMTYPVRGIPVIAYTGIGITVFGLAAITLYDAKMKDGTANENTSFLYQLPNTMSNMIYKDDDENDAKPEPKSEPKYKENDNDNGDRNDHEDEDENENESESESDTDEKKGGKHKKSKKKSQKKRKKKNRSGKHKSK